MARVLIVDDSFVARMCLSNILTTIGHTVIGEAANGNQALERYASLVPDIVTMDLTMADSDGLVAITNILAEFPEARIIVVSARQENKIIINALENGARHFIMKPVCLDKVRLIVNNVFQQNFDREKHVALIHCLKKAYENGDFVTNKKVCPARILIVDDSAITRRILREIITDLGHEVIGEAANGAQAFVEYVKLHPDLVTMDLSMTGLSGAEVISKIVATDRNARIVVISSTEVRRGIIDALERGARHFIVKPIRKEKVAVVLKNVLQQEFDLQKHREYVRDLRESENSAFLVEQELKTAIPPYSISVWDKSLVHICINQSITLNSCQALFLELEEYLNGESRVLLDFGLMFKLDKELLLNFNELIATVKSNAGMVKAVSNNRRFVDTIMATQIESKTNYLGDIIKFWDN